MQQREIYVIAHNIRSTHNVGSLFRTAEGLGITKLYLTGYTPYPIQVKDSRLPHLARKIHAQIEKTALNATSQLAWERFESVDEVLQLLKDQDVVIAALEQSPTAIKLPEYQAPDKVALLLGNEVEGLEPSILNLASCIIEIPMFGQKESFNVVQAAAMALYQLRFS